MDLGLVCWRVNAIGGGDSSKLLDERATLKCRYKHKYPNDCFYNQYQFLFNPVDTVSTHTEV